MTVVQRSGVGRSERGGRQYPKRSKRLYERGRRPTLTRVGEKQTISHRMKGGERKVRLLVADVAQVFDPKTRSTARQPSNWWLRMLRIGCTSVGTS
mgnify:CR=1 FL=1